jgi:serine/threonine protein kinase
MMTCNDFNKSNKILIGKGEYGAVYKQCKKTKCVAIKNQTHKRKLGIYEYNLQVFAHSLSPLSVPNPMSLTVCGKGRTLTFQPFIKGKTLADVISPDNYTFLILKVLRTLKRFQKKCPSFRHNDLHLDNILVDRNRIHIIDFGFAYADLDGLRNPQVNGYRDYGIYPGNDSLFDAHFFLNSVFALKRPGVSETIAGLLPAEYLGYQTLKVNHHRLRAGVKHDTLPSLDRMIFYFSRK